MKQPILLNWFTAAGGALLSLAIVANAQGPVVFTLDTNQSSITLSGSILGFALKEQGPGSLTTKFGGTLRADVNGQTIMFTGQSLIEALDNGNWQPKPDGSTGTEPANFGGQASSFLGSAKAALRQIQLDAISGPLTINQGNFDSSSLVFLFPTNAPSSAAYTVASLLGSKSGSIPLVGYATNKVSSVATFTAVPGVETLTIPVDSEFQFSLTTANDTTIRLTGQFVATHVVTAPLLIESIMVQNQVVTFQWESTPGQQFQIQSSSDLNAWQTNTANVTSTNSTYSWSGPATQSLRFYRLAQ